MYAQTQVKTHLTIFAMPAAGSHRCIDDAVRAWQLKSYGSGCCS